MGTPLGSSSPASKVGYSVRFDNSTSPSTRVKFLTEGMLLQELLRDPWLRQYSAVIIDEIHERGVNVDLVAGFLRNLVTGRKEGRGGVPLKVVTMSATADIATLESFFSGGYETAEETRELVNSHEAETDAENLDMQINRAEEPDYSDWDGFSDSDGERNSHDLQASEFQKNGSSSPGSDSEARDGELAIKAKERLSVCAIEGRQFPVQLFYAPEPVADVVDGTLRTIFQIHHSEPLPGDILVFLTGQEDIQAVDALVTEYGTQLMPGVPKILTRPLFAALPQREQQDAFLPAPTSNTRKVILATNIAETSVTVPGVRYVVDGGKAKIKQYRARLGLDSLLAKPISKSSAMQRRGRAGREAPGKCYRLYTEGDYLKLETSSTPEILRCDVTHIVLIIKARGVNDILSFPFLTSPPREALEKALIQLLMLGALNESGSISDLGRQMAALPLTPALSRVLLEAGRPEMDCLLEVIDIISGLTVESIFLNVASEEKKEAAASARKELIRREGDHLTLLTTVRKYFTEGKSDRRAWAEAHFVSHRAMQAVMDVRKQLRAQCKLQKLLSAAQGNDADDSAGVEITSPERAAVILKCFLRGFATKTARLCPDGSYRTMIGNQAIAIHPSSGLFGRKVEAIMYDDYVFTNKSYAKGVSAVQMDWIGDALGV
ncbi:MAG: putative ATP-dependent RNA helicase dhr2 [Thelocarpon impressellum]|nr:MAG: putative ATP-dependent RNA helicase dhr2 [Thelocarpon impressellum]